MTCLRIINHTNGTIRTTETPLTLREFIAVTFCAFGFYQAIRTGQNRYLINDKFSGGSCYTVEKIKKGEI